MADVIITESGVTAIAQTVEGNIIAQGNDITNIMQSDDATLIVQEAGDTVIESSEEIMIVEVQDNVTIVEMEPWVPWADWEPWEPGTTDYNELDNLPDLSVFLENWDNISELNNDVGYITDDDLPWIPTLQQVTDVGASTTNVESTFSSGIITPQVKASTSAGTTFKTNIGADWLHGGNGGSANATMYGGWNYNNATANTIASFGASKTLTSLSTATYPSLTELTYVKGVTSSIQTQLNGKQAALVSGTNIKTINGSSILGSGNLTISWGVTGATDSTLTLTGTTLGINLANANTWTGAQTIQVGTNADGVFQIKNSAWSNRFGYSTSKDQISVGDAGYNSAAWFFYIYDVTHSFKDVFTIFKGTWWSAFDIQIATLSPVIKATGGATFVNYTINDTGTYLYNSFVSGATFDIRNDTDNYNTMGFYAKAFNNNPTPSFYLAAKRCVSYGVVGEAQSNPTGFWGAWLRSYSASANIDGVRVDVLAGQTAPLFRARQVNSFYDAYMSSVTDIMTIDAQGCVNPASMADSAAANNSIYYSTTASKLVYKDAWGTVNNLY